LRLAPVGIRDSGFGIRDSGFGIGKDMADTTRDSGFPPSPAGDGAGFGEASGIRGSGNPEDGRTPDAIDHAIDVVAREMTNVDAPAGLRAAVLARIENASPRSGMARLPRWATAASLAIVVLAVAAVVWIERPGGRPESVGARVDSATATATGGAKSEPRSSETLASAGPAAAAPADARTSRNGGPVAGGGAATAEPGENVTRADDAGPAALAPPDPIVLAAVGPAALHIPDIGIEPIGELKPITIQDIPVGSTEIKSPTAR